MILWIIDDQIHFSNQNPADKTLAVVCYMQRVEREKERGTEREKERENSQFEYITRLAMCVSYLKP